MRPLTLLSLLPSLAAALPSPHPLAQILARTAPADANAVLKSVTSTGAGCAPNSAAFLFRDDATIAFDSMVLDSTLPTRTIRCLITVDIGLDPAYKYTIGKSSTTRGFVENEGASFAIKYTAAGKSISVGGPVAPTSTGNWVQVSTSAGVSSAAGGGVATFDISLSIAPVAGKNTVIAMDSLDMLFDYSK